MAPDEQRKVKLTRLLGVHRQYKRPIIEEQEQVDGVVVSALQPG
jgi:hypothetical protein